MTTTPNMNLDLPVVDSTPGPEWASLLNSALSTVDSHDHTAENGVQVPTAGILINEDLEFNSNSLNTVNILRLIDQISTPNSGIDIRCIYSKNGELAYIDSAGNEVVITNNGSVAGATGTISGLVSPASGSLDGISNVFSITFDTGKPAKTATSDIKLYEYNNASANPITIKSPSVSAAFSTTWFAALPASNRMLSVDSSGNLLTSALTGTANQITVTNAASTTTLSLPASVAISTSMLLGTGSASNPSYSFSADDTMGMYRAGSNTLAFSTTGAAICQMNTTSILAKAGAAATPAYTFISDANTGMYNRTTDVLGFSAGGVDNLQISPTSITAAIQIQSINGSASSPTYAFSNDTNSGIFRTSLGVIGFSTEGVSRVTLSSGALTSTVRYAAQDGSAATPAIGFSSDNNTGIYRIGTDNLGIAAGGSNIVDVSTSGMIVTGDIRATDDMRVDSLLQFGANTGFKVRVFSGSLTNGASTTLVPGATTIYGVCGWTQNGGSQWTSMVQAGSSGSGSPFGYDGVYFGAASGSTSVDIGNTSTSTRSYRVTIIYS